MRGPTTRRMAYLLPAWLACCAFASAQQGVDDARAPRTTQTVEATTAAVVGSYDPAASDTRPYLIERLPPVADAAAAEWVDPTPKYGQDFPGGLLLPRDGLDDGESANKTLPPGMRRAGVFQGVSLGGSWLATGTGHDALGISASSIRGDLVLPSLIPESYLAITPGFGVYRFDCPGNYDIPDDVYDASVGFGLRGKHSERLSYEVNVSVGSYSDYENSSDDQVRVRGYGSVLYKWNPTIDVLAGVAYVDLQDWPVLPVVGFIVRPDDDQILKLGFPEMGYSRRLGVTGAFGRHTEYWGSVGLEMGGGRWVVERNDDSTDWLTYRDWRLVLGLRQKTLDAYDLKFDVGYVFARRIEYDDNRESFAPDDTVSLTLTGRF
ncbi:MAG: hypothetical protein JW888_16585 [Pirellulales bacterium]|nr:hypothetical protein [Pirellulales bacterium]